GAGRGSPIFVDLSYDMTGLLFAQGLALPVQAAPEHEHAVEHAPRVLDEDVLVDGALLEEVLDLVVGMPGVIALELRMPREEAHVERHEAAAFRVAPPALDELVPEARGRPVLDRPGRRRGDRVILVAVQPDQLVAELERLGRAEAALAEIAEPEAELPRHPGEQLEVRRAEAERAAFDGALRIAELADRRTAADIVRSCREADADLVRENLLRFAHLLERIGVQHLEELRHEELVREDGELDQERAGLDFAELAAPEPGRVRVRGDDRMAEHVALEPCLELKSSFVHHEPPETDETYSSADRVAVAANHERREAPR